MFDCVKQKCSSKAGINLGMDSANERRRYIVTSSLIGWATTRNDPWKRYRQGVHLTPVCIVCRSYWFVCRPSTETNTLPVLMSVYMAPKRPVYVQMAPPWPIKSQKCGAIHRPISPCHMMTTWHGNSFRIVGPCERICRPVMWSVDVSNVSKFLDKQSRCLWFVTS